MKVLKFSKLTLIGLMAMSLLGPQLSCSKKDAEKTETPAEESEKAPAEEKAPDSAVQHKKESPQEASKQEPAGTKEAENDSDEKEEKKVTNVKEAFQYTGKEMDKGFKKTGRSIKKAFVGDGK